ncbi:MAG TPA: thioredoxin domain-containing protein [Candidatus Binatia bacterium]|nr:thioredoxin domain-containing protein [Candidatus Binatia bacterium]
MRQAVVLVLAATLIAPCVAGAAGDGSEQLIKYYRKKNNIAPGMKVAVTGVKDSSIKGAKEGTLEVGEGAGAQKSTFIATPDLKFVVFGTVEDVTVDPSKALMAKINLKGEPHKGPENAKVTIVEYSDFQCPFCSKGYQTIEKQVLTNYGDKVKFYYKNYPLPFHPWAKKGAIAAACAKEQKPDAFWKLYSFWFENQGQVNPDNVKDKATDVLKDTGIDMAKWTDCFDNQKTAAKVDAEMAEGSSVGVRGTPGFIINGRVISGAQPYENFKNVIDDELGQTASAK